jgi:hypothetical protein
LKIKCLHGFFLFTETQVGQVSDFIKGTEIELVAENDYFTFEKLIDAPHYSLVGKPYIGAVITSSLEGKPWEIMRENNLVYNLTLDLVVPLLSITQIVSVLNGGNKYLSNGLIQPGSLTTSGQRIISYTAWYNRGTQRWKFSEIEYV